MRRREPVRIGDVMGDFFASTPNIARKIAEAKIPDVWPQIVGGIIASYTSKMEVKSGGRLFVYVTSSVVRNELFMHRSALPEEINRAVGFPAVSTVIIK